MEALTCGGWLEILWNLLAVIGGVRRQRWHDYESEKRSGLNELGSWCRSWMARRQRLAWNPSLEKRLCRR